MALTQFALAALLSSGSGTLATTLTAHQLQQPQGAAAVVELAATTPKGAAPSAAMSKKSSKKTKKATKAKAVPEDKPAAGYSAG